MENYIALLRGINVGGHKKFPKAEQLEMLEVLGYRNPQVYLHTGNWVFSSPNSQGENKSFSTQIAQAIKSKYGWEVPVLVFKASEISKIFNACPFSEEIREKSYFTLLESQPTPQNITTLKTYKFPDEEYHITKRCIYFFPIHGAGSSKMSNNFFENKLRVTATSRNYKTMRQICRLL